MNDFDPTAPEPANEDVQVEISDLDLPPSQRVSMPGWARRYMQCRQAPDARQRLRKINSAGLALITVLVIALLSGNNLFSLLANQVRAGFGLFQHAAPHPGQPPLLSVSTPLTHVHGQDGIACLLDAQWSPQSDAIAMLGYEYNCPTNHDVPGILNIYNAHTGKLTAQWQLDDTILTVMNAPTIGSHGTSNPGVLASSSFQAADSGSANVGITRLLPFSYIHVMWSPDEQRLALSFIVYMQQQPFFGILVMDVNGHYSHVIFQPPNLNQQTPIEWNLATNQALGFTPVPSAFAYRWQANGSLVPFMPLSGGPQQPVSLTGPVGNPDGNETFTVWQPGFTTFTTIAGYYGWSTTFSAWSPDGRYLIDDINLQGFYKPPASIIPDVQALSKLKLRHNRLLSPRNVAALELLQGSPLVSWRPDGRVLATYYARGTIVFYDSRTGLALQAIMLPAGQHLLARSLALLHWSPDGSHLLLSSPSYGLLNIWGPGQLPQL
jgi:WD40 repeat protein